MTGGSHPRSPRLRLVQRFLFALKPPQLSARISACFISRGVIWQAGAVEEDPLRAQERELLAKAESLPLAQEESSLLARGVSFRYSSFIVTFASWRGGFAPRSPRLRLVQIISCALKLTQLSARISQLAHFCELGFSKSALFQISGIRGPEGVSWMFRLKQHFPTL